MPTTFIAIQCSQCSTMQVKQQKKSSNKWTCVVCNQKQSVRKVFAQGFMAKDVRKFVQSFNMSRKFEEQQNSDETQFEEQNIVDCDPFFKYQIQNKRRSDWSEYLDPEDSVDEKEEQNEKVCEPKIVTEWPREMFKKPKLKNYSAGSSSGKCDGLFEPLFSKRSSNKHAISQAVLHVLEIEFQPTTAKDTSKWSDHIAQDDDIEPRKCQQMKWSDYIAQDDDIEPSKCQQMKVKGDSKWKDYVYQDDDFTNHMGQLGKDVLEIITVDKDVLETITNDQRVEDDIHPDFI